MDDMNVRQGETLPLTLVLDEDGADTATITVSQDGEIFITKTASVDSDNEADLTLTAEDTDIEVGEYEYMITVVYDDGTVEKYPSSDYCEDCDLPTLEICEANDSTEAS